MADKKGITPQAKQWPNLPFRLKSYPDVMIAKVYGPPAPDGGDYAAIFETSDKPIAEYIVRACNAFPQMLEALELAEYWLMRCVPMVEIEGPRPLPIIRGAIAAAKGEGQ